jgi:hypothetical protein
VVSYWRLWLGLLFVCLAVAAAASAHDIPTDVTVQAFVKPEGQRLRVLVRVPLKAMRDVQFPLRGPGFLDLANAGPVLRDAAVLWIAGSLELFEGDTRLGSPGVSGTRVSLPSDRSFGSYDAALTHVSGSPLSNETDIPWDQAMLDVLLEYPIASDQSVFSIHPSLARLGLRVVTVLRFLPPGGTVRAFEFAGDPGLVRLDPRWHQAALRFVRLGFLHILDGTDHLLFLLCLVIPFRRVRELVIMVTAFTAGHSVTLIASAWNAGPGGLWFPPFVETIIAASIVTMALENIVLAARGQPTWRGLGQRRWVMAFAFGLVHGFGFSFALRESLQFAGAHLLTSLLSFNVGVELGQLLVLVLIVPALHLLFRFVVAERIGTIILSALVAHTGWHWTVDRWGSLRQFGWPSFDAASLAMFVRLLMVIVAAGAVAWMVAGLLAGRPRPAPEPETQEDERSGVV